MGGRDTGGPDEETWGVGVAGLTRNKVYLLLDLLMDESAILLHYASITTPSGGASRAAYEPITAPQGMAPKK